MVLDHNWIMTFTRKQFYPLNPIVSDIDIRDIAHALSNQCRFTGHARRFYSVAQHSLLVSQLCEPVDALWGLLHDASEAYLSDVSRPVKYSATMTGYRDAEHRLQRAVCKRFGLSPEEPRNVMITDRRLLVTEAEQLLTTEGWKQESLMPAFPIWIQPMYPDEAERNFLLRFEKLTGCISIPKPA